MFRDDIGHQTAKATKLKLLEITGKHVSDRFGTLIVLSTRRILEERSCSNLYTRPRLLDKRYGTTSKNVVKERN